MGMCNHDCSNSKLCSVSFGFAVGIVSGLTMLILGFIGVYSGFGHPMIHVIGSLYRGFEPTVAGAFIGGLWALVGGFISGFVMAWLYNRFTAYCWKYCHKSEEVEVKVKKVS